MIGRSAIWHTWDDATGTELAIPVVITDVFYEPGDPVPGYHLSNVVTDEPIGGICSSQVEVVS